MPPDNLIRLRPECTLHADRQQPEMSMVDTKQATVESAEYEPEWPSRYEAEKCLLPALIGNWLYGSVEHLGSTAVPGLAANPVIDIM